MSFFNPVSWWNKIEKQIQTLADGTLSAVQDSISKVATTVVESVAETGNTLKDSGNTIAQSVGGGVVSGFQTVGGGIVYAYDETRVAANQVADFCNEQSGTIGDFSVELYEK